MILGITGTIGAGKGTLARYLTKHYGAIHISARSVIEEHLPPNPSRKQLVDMGNELRKKHGAHYMAKALIDRAKNNSLSVVESFRTLAGCDYLHTFGGILFAVDAPQEIRYKRIVERKSSTDTVSFQQFQKDELREAAQTDPTKQNILGCIEKADYIFTNETTLDAFYTQVDAVMKQLL